MRTTNNKLIVHLENFFTRTDVEKLKGKKIFSKSLELLGISAMDKM